MTTLDTLDAVVEEELSPDCSFTRVLVGDDQRLTPMAVAMGAAQSQITRRVVLYEVTGAWLHTYAMPGLDLVPVIHSAERARLMSGVALALDPRSPARPFLSSAGAALCLHILSSFASQRGFPSVAGRLQARANELRGGAFLGSWVGPEGEETASTVNELTMAMSCFDVLHEMGHVHAWEHPSNQVLTDEELKLLLRQATVRHPEVQNQSNLSLRELHQEICADVTCLNWLWVATRTGMQVWAKQQFNPFRFALAAISIFGAFAIVNLCQQVADDCSRIPVSVADETENEYRSYALRVGFAIRSEIARDIAVQLATRELGADSKAGTSISLRQLSDRLGLMFDGFEFALAEAYRYAERPVPTLWRDNSPSAAASAAGRGRASDEGRRNVQLSWPARLFRGRSQRGRPPE